MAQTYMIFDFPNEEKAQEARHKLETWKQAGRLDQKLQYKFERPEGDQEETAAEEEKPAKTKASAKGKGKTASKKEESDEPVKLLVRLSFSGHEKLTEQRWLDRIPTEEPFKDASPETVKSNDKNFDGIETRFENLD